MLCMVAAMRAARPLPHDTMLGQPPRAASAHLTTGRLVGIRQFNSRPGRRSVVHRENVRFRRIGAGRRGERSDGRQDKQNHGWSDFHSGVPVFVFRPQRRRETSGAQVGDSGGVSMIGSRRLFSDNGREVSGVADQNRFEHIIAQVRLKIVDKQGNEFRKWAIEIKRDSTQGTVEEIRCGDQPRRLSRKTPCSPNRFQNHHGALKRSGLPHAFSAKARSILAPATSQRSRKSLMVQKWMFGDSHHA